MTPPPTATVSATPVSSASPGSRPQADRLKAAAKDFEAIFVRQMLAAARKSHFGGDELFGGQGLDTFRQMQDERFADIAAERGAFGIGRMLEAQVARSLPTGEAR